MGEPNVREKLEEWNWFGAVNKAMLVSRSKADVVRR